MCFKVSNLYIYMQLESAYQSIAKFLRFKLARYFVYHIVGLDLNLTKLVYQHVDMQYDFASKHVGKIGLTNHLPLL